MTSSSSHNNSTTSRDSWSDGWDDLAGPTATAGWPSSSWSGSRPPALDDHHHHTTTVVPPPTARSGDTAVAGTPAAPSLFARPATGADPRAFLGTRMPRSVRRPWPDVVVVPTEASGDRPAAPSSISSPDEHERRLSAKIAQFLSAQRERMATKVQQAVEQQMQDGWQRERQVYMAELMAGRRWGGVAALVPTAPRAVPLETAARRSTDPPPPPPRQSSSSTTADQAERLPRALTTLSDPTPDPLDPTWVQVHGDLIIIHGGPRDRSLPTLDLLDQLLAWISSSSSSPPAAESSSTTTTTSMGGSSGYKAAAQLLRAQITFRQQQQNNNNNNTTSSSSSSSFSPLSQAQAVLIYSCHSFYEYMTQRVRQAALLGQEASFSGSSSGGNNSKPGEEYTDETARWAARLAALMAPPKAPPPSIWPVLYFLLRCGNARAAHQVLTHPTAGPPASVLKVVQSLAQHQGNNNNNNNYYSNCWWEQGIPTVPWPDRLALQQQEEAFTASSSGPDVYRTACLSLLSGLVPWPSSDQAGGLATIEDYLTGALWKALWQPNPLQELIDLGRLMKRYGPQHFEGGGAGGWSLAWPLLWTQQVHRALSHVAQVGGALGLLQATHLAWLMHQAGLPLHDLGTDPSEEEEEEEHLTHSKSTKADSSLLSQLLVSYANMLASDERLGPFMALEYLVLLPSKSQVRHEVAQLIVGMNASQRTKLMGTFDEQGRRSPDTLLDQKFSPEDIVWILGEAAQMHLRRSGESGHGRLPELEAAMVCFMLSDRYADLLQLLSELLSPPDQIHEEKQLWVRRTELFHQVYLSQKTHVSDVLERQGQSAVIQTNRTLCSLNHFFDKMQLRRYSDAWSILDPLKLLPATKADVEIKGVEIKRMDPLIRQAYPSILVAVMQILYHEYVRLKNDDWQESSALVVRQRLKEEKDEARKVIMMASMLGMNPDQITNMSRLESLMV